jgi:hypothetical protein
VRRLCASQEPFVHIVLVLVLVLVFIEMLVRSPKQRESLQLPPQLLPGDFLDEYFYSHFFSKTTSDMEISRCLDVDFWRDSFNSPSQDEICVRSATIALGAAHWLFTTPAGGNKDVNGFIIRHYNQAISELLVKSLELTQNDPSNLPHVLTCCFMFVLLESLRGNYGKAIRHLESGSRIITTSTATGNLATGTAVRKIAATFHAISSQLSIFSEDRLFPDLTDFMAPMKKYHTAAPTLRDLDEAEDVLSSFDDAIVYLTCDLPQTWDDKTSECCRQWSTLKQAIDAWGLEFHELVQGLSPDDQGIAARNKILNLRIQHKMWEICMAADRPAGSESDDADDQDTLRIAPGDCLALLDDIEVLWKDSHGPTFGLKTDLVTAIYQLYVFCPDRAVRQRVISLLRSRKRRQICWDSVELAEFWEADLSLREIGIQRPAWPDIGPSVEEGAMLVFQSAY